MKTYQLVAVLSCLLGAACTYHGSLRDDFHHPELSTRQEQKLPLRAMLSVEAKNIQATGAFGIGADISLRPGLDRAIQSELATVFEVTSTRDAYLYLYSVDMDWNAVLIFPNDYFQDNYVKAAQLVVYPSEEVKRKGIKVVARLPVGATVSAEMIRVIASKTPLPKSIVYAAEREHGRKDFLASSEIHGQGSFLNLMRELSRTDTEWVEDAQAFTIHQR